MNDELEPVIKLYASYPTTKDFLLVQYPREPIALDRVRRPDRKGGDSLVNRGVRSWFYWSLTILNMNFGFVGKSCSVPE